MPPRALQSQFITECPLAPWVWGGASVPARGRGCCSLSVPCLSPRSGVCWHVWGWNPCTRHRGLGFLMSLFAVGSQGGPSWICSWNSDSSPRSQLEFCLLTWAGVYLFYLFPQVKNRKNIDLWAGKSGSIPDFVPSASPLSIRGRKKKIKKFKMPPISVPCGQSLAAVPLVTCHCSDALVAARRLRLCHLFPVRVGEVRRGWAP